MINFLIKKFVKDYNNYSNARVRNSYGSFCGIMGIILNVFLASIKFIAGLMTSSIAVMADSFNNLSDAGSSIISLIGFKMSNKPADDDHPFGHGRAEYISGFIVSIVIFLMGIELLKSSILSISSPKQLEINIISIIILCISIGVKFWMFLFNKKIGKKIKSVALQATATDSIADVTATLAVLISMLISFFTSWNIDAYAGIIVSFFIIYAGFGAAKETTNLLLGQGVDEDFVAEIRKKALSYQYIEGIHDFIVHSYGSNKKLISFHAEVPCTADIIEIHDVIDNIERDLKKEFGCETVIHMDPVAVDDVETIQLKHKVANLMKVIDEKITIHDFRMVNGTTHTNLIFDAVLPHKFRLNDEQFLQAARLAIKTLDESYEIVVTVDRNYT